MNSVNILELLGEIFITLTERLNSYIFSDFIVSPAFNNALATRNHSPASLNTHRFSPWAQLGESEAAWQMEAIHQSRELLLTARLRLLHS